MPGPDACPDGAIASPCGLLKKEETRGGGPPAFGSAAVDSAASFVLEAGAGAGAGAGGADAGAGGAGAAVGAGVASGCAEPRGDNICTWWPKVEETHTCPLSGSTTTNDGLLKAPSAPSPKLPPMLPTKAQ